MNFTVALLTTIFALAVLVLPRRAAMAAIIGAVCYVTQGQVLDFLGFHFTAIRLVLLAGLIRVLLRGEYIFGESNVIDKAVWYYSLVSAAIYIVRVHSTDAVVYQFGVTYNILMAYLVIRSLVRGIDDLLGLLPYVAVVIIPLAVAMGLEAMNGHNLFSFMGGIPEVVEFRDGHYRCQGSFRSPITAGTLGATLMPFFAGAFWAGKKKAYAVIGFIAATLIMLFAHSSGPLIAYVVAVITFLCWKLRRDMRRIRWSALIILTCLHLVMKAPVWFLMARMGDLVGGGGYHRAEIFDQFVNNMRSWWFMGTSETAGWMAYQLTDGTADLTNQFVVAGVTGGIVALAYFVAIVARSFQYLGRAMAAVRITDPAIEKLLWAVSASLFATIVNFFSVSYFDQIGVVWYLLLAVIASGTADVLRGKEGVKVKSGFSSPLTNGRQPSIATAQFG